jgi:hypothetical protein
MIRKNENRLSERIMEGHAQKKEAEPDPEKWEPVFR